MSLGLKVMSTSSVESGVPLRGSACECRKDAVPSKLSVGDRWVLARLCGNVLALNVSG